MEFRNLMVDCLESDKLDSKIYSELCRTVYQQKVTKYEHSDVQFVFLDNPERDFDGITTLLAQLLVDFASDYVMTYNIENGICAHFNLDAKEVCKTYKTAGDFIDRILLPAVRRKLESFNLKKTELSTSISNISDNFVHVCIRVAGTSNFENTRGILRRASAISDRLRKKFDTTWSNFPQFPNWFSSFSLMDPWYLDTKAYAGNNMTCTSKDYDVKYEC